MKNIAILPYIFFLFLGCQYRNTPKAQDIITEDIPRFWEAFDSIHSTKDTLLQMKYLDQYYLSQGSIGLQGLIRARNYTPKEFLKAITSYPEYWKSIRQSTLAVDFYAKDIQKGIDQFKALYPHHKPARVCFEIGAFRTPGTAIDSLVLIGVELAMTDSSTVTHELPKYMEYVENYTLLNPIQDLPFLNVHEYVHTQQNATGGYDLLSQSLFEGSAEFIAEIAMNQPSIQSSIKYGLQNDAVVRQKFVKEMFSPWYYNWIWNSSNNSFNMRDLGYYMGYAIVKSHYNRSADKKEAIKEIIEIDYTSQEAVEGFAEQSGYFEKSLAEYKADFEANRPTVTDVEYNLSDDLKNPSITVHFSRPMDGYSISTSYSLKGENYFPKIDSARFTNDNKAVVYYIKAEPDVQYEMVINSGFRDPNTIPLKPDTISFTIN